MMKHPILIRCGAIMPPGLLIVISVLYTMLMDYCSAPGASPSGSLGSVLIQYLELFCFATWRTLCSGWLFFTPLLAVSVACFIAWHHDKLENPNNTSELTS